MIRIDTGFYIFDRSIITFFYKKKYSVKIRFIRLTVFYTLRDMILCIDLVMRNKQDIAVLIFSSVSLREIHSVKLRVVKIIKHGVSQSGFHRGTRS
jgi:hypothetical protein